MRVTGFNVVIASQWMDPGETERGIRWARETFASLTPYLAPTRYVNYLEDDARDAAAVVLRTEPRAPEGDQDEVRPRTISSGTTSTFCRSEPTRDASRCAATIIPAWIVRPTLSAEFSSKAMI